MRKMMFWLVDLTPENSQLGDHHPEYMVDLCWFKQKDHVWNRQASNSQCSKCSKPLDFPKFSPAAQCCAPQNARAGVDGTSNSGYVLEKW